jgi:hypothetical protein
MSTFEIRVGDVSPQLAYRVGIDLSDVISVNFSARDKLTDVVFIDDQPALVADGTYRINGVMTPLTPADGVVIYQWQLADTATVRPSVECLFKLVRDGAAQETWPSKGFIRVTINENF